MKEADELFQKNEYKRAAETFSYLVKTTHYGQNPLVLTNLARCYMNLDQHEDAIENFEKAGNLLLQDEDADEAMLQKTFYMLGVC